MVPYSGRHRSIAVFCFHIQQSRAGYDALEAEIQQLLEKRYNSATNITRLNLADVASLNVLGN